MNIDKFINEYYDRLYKSDKTTNEQSEQLKQAELIKETEQSEQIKQPEKPEELEKTKKTKESKPLKIKLKRLLYKSIPILLLSGSIISYLLSGLFFFWKYYTACIISFIVFILTLILMPIWDNSDTRRHEKIKAQATIIEDRIRCLIDLLNEWNISLSSENINNLIEATIENKPKHSNIRTFLKFVSIIRSGISFYIPIIITIIFCDSIISKIDLATIELFVILIKITFIFLVVLIFYASLYCFYITDIDPYIRKIYHFHDTVVTDLRQLNCFRVYYGLDATENETSSADKEETTTEEEISITNPIQNIEINIEATLEKKKESKKQKETKKKKRKK